MIARVRDVIAASKQPGSMLQVSGSMSTKTGLAPSRLIIVPLDWRVQWDWQSADSTAPHSLVVMAEREKLPTEGGRAAFTNAMTRMLAEGLQPGQGDQTTFTADQAGWYWMLCGVPVHALEGEYIVLRVDPEAKTADVQTK